ncbi:MAG TPA: VOC family protein [Pyrinomonadaceae bacterium]|nr:VOC family protein [Pyrinomonadaceae bacterium]
MAEFTIPKHGEICWRELNTQNLDAAKTFYQGLFGWNLEQSKVSPVQYDEIHFNGEAVGGMMQITKEWGENWEKIPSSWMSYIAVENCDETIEKIKLNGGDVCIPAFDAPGVGRMSVVKDPSGAAFSIIQFVQ